MRSLIASLVVAIAALASVAWATDGFRVLTSEQARRLSIAENPVTVPNVDLFMANGDVVSLHQLLSTEPGVTVVGFFYSSCQSICLALASDFQQLQNRIRDEGLGNQLRLLSISFDPATDSPEVLSEYQKRMGVQQESWRVAAANNLEELPDLLDAFGIRVIDDGMGGFVHNSAFHVVNTEGELIAIVDFTRAHAVLDYIEGDAG